MYTYMVMFLCSIAFVHKRVLDYHIFLGGKSKIIMKARNGNSKF